MKIIITGNNKKYSIPLPISILTHLPVCNKEKFTKAQLNEFLQCIKAHKKEFGSFVLLELEELNGEIIKIII